MRYVHDGDTLYPPSTARELKVRLLGIDSRRSASGPSAPDAATARALLPEGSRVLVLADREPLDQYGRSLLHVFPPDGTHVNLLLIEEARSPRSTVP